MSNQNGQYVLFTLAKMRGPAKLPAIVKKVATQFGGDATPQLEQQLEETLEAGVRCGIIEKRPNGSYKALVSKSFVKYLAKGVQSVGNKDGKPATN